MNEKDIVIKAENISKCYRIGLKETMSDSFARSAFNSIIRPLKNYRKYRSLYKFDDIQKANGSHSNSDTSDIIWALKGISFEVKRGEVFGIIGRNGAGKSTLLKILSKITSPTKGYAKLHGRISSLLEVGTGFHPELTGRENVYLNGTIMGMRKKEVDRKFDEIVDFSGVEKFIDTPVKRYSSGMTVRLAFAVAAHLEPEIMIIDEVLAVGDAAFQKKCLNKMDDISNEGRTVIFVSHNMMAVTRLCSRVMFIEDGIIHQDGSPEETVSTYLGYGFDRRSERIWDDSAAPGAEIVRLRAVRVITDDGRTSDTVRVDQAFNIQIEYEVCQSGYVLLPNVQLYNEHGIMIFSTHDTDPVMKRKPRAAGYYVSSVRIPENLLTTGIKTVSVGCETLKPSIFQFYLPDIVCLSVIESYESNTARGDYEGQITGVIRPLLQWSTRQGKNGNEFTTS